MFELDRIRITHSDCLPQMRNMQDDEIDLAIVDPPYGLPKKYLKPGSKISMTGVERLQYKQGIEKLYDGVPNDEYFKELFRISKHQVIFGINYFDINPGPGRIIWIKNNPVFSNAEIAYHSFGYGVYVFQHTWSGFCKETEHKEKRIHPTQKPVALYKWILTKFAKPGWRILDTHLGSGSSAIACWDMGFNFVGFEKDEQFYRNAVERVAKHTRQMKLELTDV